MSQHVYPWAQKIFQNVKAKIKGETPYLVYNPNTKQWVTKSITDVATKKSAEITKGTAHYLSRQRFLKDAIQKARQNRLKLKKDFNNDKISQTQYDKQNKILTDQISNHTKVLNDISRKVMPGLKMFEPDLQPVDEVTNVEHLRNVLSQITAKYTKQQFLSNVVIDPVRKQILTKNKTILDIFKTPSPPTYTPGSLNPPGQPYYSQYQFKADFRSALETLKSSTPKPHRGFVK
jgi:hypothetical protein